ncbi:MAG: hypothetical protein Q7S86_04015 [bacterium]|nr:hypothetical protein [bacterium]
MGDIIEVDFGGGEREKKNPTLENMPEVSDLSAEVLPFTPKLSGEKGGLASFDQVRSQLTALNDFLRGVRAPRSETAALRQDMVSEMTFLEICDAISYSSENEWRARPAYFRAVADAFWVKFASKGATFGPRPSSGVPTEPDKPKSE